MCDANTKAWFNLARDACSLEKRGLVFRNLGVVTLNGESKEVEMTCRESKPRLVLLSGVGADGLYTRKDVRVMRMAVVADVQAGIVIKALVCQERPTEGPPKHVIIPNEPS